MLASLAVIVTRFLEGYIEKTLRGFSQAHEFQVYYYSDFKSLAPIYRSLPKCVQGVVVSGSFPARVLELSFPGSPRLIRAFNNDNAGIYKLFLELLNRDRTLNLDRVYADVLDVARVRPDEFLFGAYDENLSDVTHARVSEMSLDDLTMAEETYAERHIELRRNGLIDISVTRFSSIVERLRQAGLNVRFAYPDISFVRSVLSSALQDVTIKGLTDNLPCSVIITARRNTCLTAYKLRHEINELGSHLSVFGAAMKISYHMQQREDGFEIFTNNETARIITEDFTECALQNFLSARQDLSWDIGYGIGFSLYQAHVNAADAAREAYNLPSAASCLKNERDELIAPLSAEKKIVIPLNYSDLVKRLAKESGLSCLTIQKIMSVSSTLPTDNVTSEELSYKLSLTKRSVNRFLSALHKSGLASIAGKKQTASRGRPEYIYELKLDQHP